MKQLLNGVDTFVVCEGQGNDIICLLGWGQDSRMFLPTLKHLSNRFKVSILDLPGFGESGLMSRSWSVDDYVNWLRAYIEQENINQPIFIAHSFGARVAIKYAAQYPVLKMVLTGAAGLKPKRGLSYYSRVYSYKVAKQIFKLPFMNGYKEQALKHFGSSDYKALEGVLRESFVKIVNEDLRKYLPQISASTLLIWGENDDATPLWMGQVMEKEMKDAGLVVFQNDGHYAYWNQIDRFHKIVDQFLKEDAHG